VGENARLDLRRLDPWEKWETTGSKVRPGLEGGSWEERGADVERNVEVNARLRGGGRRCMDVLEERHQA